MGESVVVKGVQVTETEYLPFEVMSLRRPEQEGFYYGESPIVQATFTGEALMLREWTLKLVPEIVKKDLPGNTPEAGATPDASAAK